jgi:hypothetical protein
MISTFIRFYTTIKLILAMNLKITLSILSVFVLLIVACEKQPGDGGTSTIRGSVITREYNGNFQVFRGEYPSAKEDVYIIYGGDSTKFYGDHTQTSWDGKYEFNFLQEGDYIIFAYSKDSTELVTTEKIAVLKRVEITKKNQTVEAPVITIIK